MSNIDKQAQKELYAKVERQAHSLRGSPCEYQALTGLCPVNVIEMHAKKIQALLDELEAAEKRIAELEARQLVVKIPAYVDGRTLGYGEVNHMIDLCVDAFERACHSAGINLTVEG